MIRYRNVEHNDTIDIINLSRSYGKPAVIDGYDVDEKVWCKEILSFLDLAENGQAVFKVAHDDDCLVAFIIGIPNSWHYSPDMYLDLIEIQSEEALAPKERAEIIMELLNLAEAEARRVGLKGLSVYSIRDTSRAFSNFFTKRLGWTQLYGAKKIF